MDDIIDKRRASTSRTSIDQDLSSARSVLTSS
jgi:hypothetical protein